MRWRSCPTWVAYLAVTVLMTVAYYAVPWEPVRTAIMGGLGVLSAVAIVVGVRMHRPAVRWPWYLVAVGRVLFTAGDISYGVQNYLTGQDTFPSFADALYLVYYPMLAAALLGLVRARRPGKDRAGLLDALVLSTGAAMLAWLFLIVPYVRDGELTFWVRTVSLMFPVGDILVFAVLLRLTTGRGDRPVAYKLLVASTAAMLVGDVVYALQELTVGYETGDPVDAAWFAMYGLVGAAALHPSIVDISRRAVTTDEGVIDRRRLSALALASLMAPAVLAIEWARGMPLDVPVIVLGSVVLFLLVIARLHDVVQLLSNTLATVEAQATTDQLTGLANRRLFHRRWEHSLADTVGPTALLYIDLDGFKPVNDALGHVAGDAVLATVADRLRGAVRVADVVARLGGDEFAVIMPWTDDRTAREIGERIVATLTEPVEVGGRTVCVGASVGVVTATRGADPEDVLRSADQAMYRAKAAGRGQVCGPGSVPPPAVDDARSTGRHAARDPVHRASSMDG